MSLISETGNEYSIGEKLDIPDVGSAEREQLERQADSGTFSIDDAEYYHVSVLGSTGYLETNTDARYVLYWPSEQRGCVLESSWCYWADGDSPLAILTAWFNGE